MMDDQFGGPEDNWGLQAIVGGGGSFTSSSGSIQISSISVTNEENHEKKPNCCPVQSAISSIAAAYVPKYKRRKNQEKRVVIQVTAEDLSSDMWAWRKYGQKPIKGSPYPRSYYRCSSSKGCLARKQVEQSCTDPSVFIITYTAEHSHSQPTKKNALAGTVRHRFFNSKSLSRATSKTAKVKDSSGDSSPASSNTTATVVPSPLINASIENIDYNNPKNIKQEMISIGDDQQMIDNNVMVLSWMMIFSQGWKI